MEFSIDIHTHPDGKIVIEDFAKEYGQYLDEDIEDVVSSYDLYKYSESASLNTIIKVGIDEATLMDVLLNDHTTDIDLCEFKVAKDGYYVIDHIVLPNLTWYNNASDDYKQYYDTIYIINEGKIYKELKGELVECTVKEVLERNNEGTTIKKCKVNVFFTGNLQQCYINYCKKLFNSQLNKCNSISSEDTYARDFIWMTLNVIEYLIDFGQFMEAERILNTFTACNGFCSGNNTKLQSGCGCGCSKT